ncbi:citrate synthase [Trinickia symbiotica]|uniref:citrate synthase (unknown stereospecificity) n=1 Tax=Trinickia symbiotica TaxID=863227 RepID=A0A2N7WTA0_9BURK|nr:citrate synthase family protein [Trinickia symbiotica]PMS32706.1 helix-turn-helix domain-containing protein [Trinickia symbiotica]PPK42204.1 citrate synthase [Trinickia symbiotica]
MPAYLTASEAAALLQISVPTLYSYVSRGMLRSAPEANGKRRLYAADDVRRLARRKADGKRAGKVAQKVLDWGVPVLESRITLIADGRLYYRGHDAIELARAATLEEAAAILWECERARIDAAPDAPLAARQWDAWLKLTRTDAPHERALVLLPAAAKLIPRIWALDREAQLDTGVALMSVLAAALVRGRPSRGPLHRQFAHAWGIRNRRHVELLRAALVVCADHELNASTFTVRCIASTGMHLFGAVTGGLAALAGPRHCGETMRVSALFAEVDQAGDVDRYLAAHLARHDDDRPRTILPGFGHPLYPQGDPRATVLLAMLDECAGVRTAARARLNQIEAITHAAGRSTGLAPTVDFALSSIERVVDLPPGAAFALFALGRAAGWIAHALEQMEDGRLIRPRARYVGAYEPPAYAGAHRFDHEPSTIDMPATQQRA